MIYHNILKSKNVLTIFVEIFKLPQKERKKERKIYVRFYFFQERNDFLHKLTSVEDWLYSEGEEQPEAVYKERLNELKVQFNLYLTRYI